MFEDASEIAEKLISIIEEVDPQKWTSRNSVRPGNLLNSLTFILNSYFKDMDIDHPYLKSHESDIVFMFEKIARLHEFLCNVPV